MSNLSADQSDDDFVPPPPKCTGAPEHIWLIVGDIDVDCKWGDLDEVTWCSDKQFDADIKYVRADTIDQLREDAERWRTLINCARITAMGSAGIMKRNENGYAHVTLNFWTHGERESGDYARDWLRSFVEIAQKVKT